MKVIKQSFEILDWSGLDLYQRVETAAWVCRRSETKGDAEGFVRSLIKRGHFSPLEFARIQIGGPDVHGRMESESVRRIREIARAEDDAWMWSLLKRLKVKYPALVADIDTEPSNFPLVIPNNDWIPVLFTTSRTISHQLVRYRHNICFMQESQRHCRYDETGIEVIAPPNLGQVQEKTWVEAMQYAEHSYLILMHHGASAEQARSVLPGCTATRILAYASPEEWRHIFSQRCTPHADPQMQELMYPLRSEMERKRLI